MKNAPTFLCVSLIKARYGGSYRSKIIIFSVFGYLGSDFCHKCFSPQHLAICCFHSTFLNPSLAIKINDNGIDYKSEPYNLALEVFLQLIALQYNFVSIGKAKCLIILWLKFENRANPQKPQKFSPQSYLPMW